MFTEFSQVLASIRASIYGYMSDDEKCDEICVKVCVAMEKLRAECVIPIIINDLQINVYRWELDKTSKIHQLLAKCHAEVGCQLRQEIDCLFSDII